MSRSKGDQFENRAVEFLLSQGYKIIQRNFYAKKLGEIDIICSKDNTYHFVEVKSGESFEAVYNITYSKLQKLVRSVEYYLQKYKISASYCIDAIVFNGEELEYLENITL